MPGIRNFASEYLTGIKIDSSPPVTTTDLEQKEVLNTYIINAESASRTRRAEVFNRYEPAPKCSFVICSTYFSRQATGYFYTKLTSSGNSYTDVKVSSWVYSAAPNAEMIIYNYAPTTSTLLKINYLHDSSTHSTQCNPKY
jgi:hypothetical protein